MMMFTHESEMHVACNLNFLLVTQGLLKVTGSHVHCKRFSILETLQDSDILTAYHY